MALRVLLADESSTIKKVFQLALQDFAVEVRPVNIGVDVVPVAQGFKPDIIFADVLLQKKNGYDVSAEVKQNPSLKDIPVVLMWSGFMELDEDKFQACMANAQLEKPFDVGALRKLVTDLVPRTNNQKLSQYLSFPKMPDLEEKAPPPPAEAAPQELAEEEDFQQVPIPKMKGTQDSKFRLNLKPEELDPDHVPVDFAKPSDKIKVAIPEPAADEPKEEFAVRETRNAKAASRPAPVAIDEVSHSELELEDLVREDSMKIPMPPPAPTVQVPTGLNADQLEKIIREQSAEVIESVVWKVVPEIATQIIERELNRLLKERDQHPY